MPSSTRDHNPSTASIPPPTVSTLQLTPSASLQGPSQLHLPSSPHRTLRKLASAHNLGSVTTGSLRAASITNPPSLITQQRAQHHHHHQHQHQQQQQQQQQQPPPPPPPPHQQPLSHSHSSYGLLRQQQQQQCGLFPVRQRNVSSTVGSSVLGISNRSPTRGRANSDAPTFHQLNAAAAAAMSSHALRNSGALTRRNMAYDHLALERLVRDGPPDGDLESALESARYKVLQQEVKSDTDGMVS